jgi:hypothetical protein
MSWRERARKMQERPPEALTKLTEAPFVSSVSSPDGPLLPALVTCGSCQHFEQDAINPGGGIGRCTLGLAFRPGERSRWPMTERSCPEWGAA